VGWGRVRDATGVYDAYVLERRLTKDGAISGPLSRATRRKLAALSYLAPRFGAVHDRSKRFFWREVERILREDDAFDEGAWGAFAMMRADEPVAFGSLRQAGYFVGPTIEASVRHETMRRTMRLHSLAFRNDTLVSSIDFPFSDSQRRLGDVARAGMQAELHAPVGWRWQIDLAGRLLSPPRDFLEALEIRSDARVSYRVADRWAVHGFVNQARDLSEPFPGTDRRVGGWTVNYGATLSFYAEDRLSFDLRAEEGQAHQRSPIAGDFRYLRGAQVMIGTTYRFLGGLDAPGLIEPTRSLSLGGAERSW
jgi:hypothetical protein